MAALLVAECWEPLGGEESLFDTPTNHFLSQKPRMTQVDHFGTSSRGIEGFILRYLSF
jgi:hypothetical protein